MTTNDDNSPLDLDAIAARANAAYPPPWRAGVTENEAKVWAHDPEALGGPSVGERCVFIANKHYPHTANREFIAHARDDVPALVARVRDLTAELDEARRLLAKATRGELPRCVTCGDRLATRRWRDTSDDVCGLCLREEIDEARDDGLTLDLTACEDLPHALALRAALKANPRRKTAPATPETP
jgi:hypothetical protein